MTRRTGPDGRARATRPALETLERRDLLSAAPAPVLAAGVDQPIAIQAVPNDPRFAEQWGLSNRGADGGRAGADVKAAAAWDTSTGSSRNVVALVDTGVDYRHVDLSRNIWINQGEIPAAVRARLIDTDSDGLVTFWDLNDSRNKGTGKITDQDADGRITAADLLKPYRADGLGGWADGVSNDGDAYKDDLVGWNFVNNTNNPFDDNGHGTHVAGLLGATGNDGVGIVGLNWRVGMMALKVMDSTGNGSVSRAIDALNYAVAKGVKISNQSWGGLSAPVQALDTALSNARAKGHIAVFSAGNGGSDYRGDNNDVTPYYPASYGYDNVVAVAATDRTDTLAVFSNYGPTSVDIAAPGADVLSTAPNNGYSKDTGTSMAVPLVSGTLALVWAKNPTWTYGQVIQRVLSTADSLPTLTGKIASGRLNVAAALGTGGSTTPTPVTPGPRVLSAVTTGSSTRAISTVRVTFNEAMNSATLVPSAFTLTGPAGHTIPIQNVKAVANSTGKQFDVAFATQVAPGAYKLTVLQTVRGSNGKALDQNANGKLGENPLDRYTATFSIVGQRTFSSSASVALKDMARTVATIAVNEDLTIADLNVRLNLSHTWDGDLFIKLRGPDGTELLLVNRRGGSGDNFTNTILDDDVVNSVRLATAPFAGSFQPEERLSRFDGKNARGTWQLIVEDKQSGDVGKLLSWSLAFTPAGQGGLSVLSLGVAPPTGSASGDESIAVRGQTRGSEFVLPGDEGSEPAVGPAAFIVSLQRIRLVDQVFASPEPMSRVVVSGDALRLPYAHLESTTEAVEDPIEDPLGR